MNHQKHSPIKTAPLRQAGESLRYRMDEIYYEKIFPALATILTLFFVGCLELFYYYFNINFSPLVWFIAGALFSIYLYKKIKLDLREVRSIKLGMDGEKKVDEILQNLRKDGYVVHPDLVNEKGNIDSILIGPAGIFTIEIKTYSKPKGGGEISYDGKNILIDGTILEKDTIKQAIGEKCWLEDFIIRNIGLEMKVKVQPIIIYCGWFIDSSCKQADVWIIPLDEHWLRNCLKARQKILDNKQISILSHLIGNYIRNNQAK